MSCKERTVSYAEQRHANVVKTQEYFTQRWNGQSGHSDSEMAEMRRVLSFTDGVYMTNGLALFVGELRKLDKHLQFAANDTEYVAISPVSGMDAVCSVLVYYAGDRYAMAEIRYGKVGVRNAASTPNKFAVLSRKINNEKYASYRDQFYMSASTDLHKAVKTFRRYAIPYAPYEIAQMTVRSTAHKVIEAKTKPRMARYGARNEIRADNAFWDDVLRLYESGHKFSSPKVNAEFQKWVDAKREEREREAKAVHICAVEVLDDGGFSLTKVMDVTDDTAYKKLPPTSPMIVTQEGLPESMQQKLALLSMMEPDAYVEDVGMRTDDWFYWVHIDGNEI
jgi:hypothetical protein